MITKQSQITIRQIVQRLGGIAEVSKACRVTDMAVRYWISRGSIPRKYWLYMVERGVTPKELFEAQ